MSMSVHGSSLLDIPVVDAGPAIGLTTLEQARDRADALMTSATAHVPRSLLHLADRVSRHWLERAGDPYLGEIDAIAQRLQRPGVYFLAVNYEWGCTVRVAPSENGEPRAELVRVLDWRTPGLGRNIIAARVPTPHGAYLALTWPGFTGVLQAVARGRFAASINQAPMHKLGGGLYPLDWAANKARVWRLRHVPAAHLLRRVFETAPTFADARRQLTETPIAAPAIFSLAGLDADQTCIIERTETDAHVHAGACGAANHWQAHGWRGRARGERSEERAAHLLAHALDYDGSWSWLRPPVLNSHTRLVMLANASTGRVVAQGFEAEKAATRVLEVTAPQHLDHAPSALPDVRSEALERAPGNAI